jgi:hypothetical protein
MKLDTVRPSCSAGPLPYLHPIGLMAAGLMAAPCDLPSLQCPVV